MIKGVDALLGLCERIAVILANTLLVAMVAANLLTMLVRELMGKGIVSVFPATMVGFAWLVFIGFFIVYRRKADVVMAVLVGRCKGLTEKVLRTASLICVILLLGIILAQAPQVYALTSSNVEIIEFPKIWVITPLFISCGLLILECLVDLVRVWTGQARRAMEDYSL